MPLPFRGLHSGKPVLLHNPGAGVSSMTLNPDGSIRSLGRFTEVTSGGGERQVRFALLLSFSALTARRCALGREAARRCPQSTVILLTGEWLPAVGARCAHRQRVTAHSKRS